MHLFLHPHSIGSHFGRAARSVRTNNEERGPAGERSAQRGGATPLRAERGRGSPRPKAALPLQAVARERRTAPRRRGERPLEGVARGGGAERSSRAAKPLAAVAARRRRQPCEFISFWFGWFRVEFGLISVSFQWLCVRARERCLFSFIHRALQ